MQRESSQKLTKQLCYLSSSKTKACGAILSETSPNQITYYTNPRLKYIAICMHDYWYIVYNEYIWSSLHTLYTSSPSNTTNSQIRNSSTSCFMMKPRILLHQDTSNPCSSLECTVPAVHPNLAVTILVISVILTSLLSNNVPHIINKIWVILYFIQNHDIHSRTLN